MFKKRIASVVGLLVAPALGACAHAVALPENEPSHIATIEVIQHDKGAPPEFAEVLRQTVVREAVYYGGEGKPYDLKIDLDKVHFKNFLVAITISDDAHANGRVTLTDPATGKQKPPIKLEVGAKRDAKAGPPVAEAVMSTTAFHNSAAATMIDNFAFFALVNTFGEARMKAARAAQQEQSQQRKAH